MLIFVTLLVTNKDLNFLVLKPAKCWVRLKTEFTTTCWLVRPIAQLTVGINRTLWITSHDLPPVFHVGGGLPQERVHIGEKSDDKNDWRRRTQTQPCTRLDLNPRPKCSIGLMHCKT